MYYYSYWAIIRTDFLEIFQPSSSFLYLRIFSRMSWARSFHSMLCLGVFASFLPRSDRPLIGLEDKSTSASFIYTAERITRVEPRLERAGERSAKRCCCCSRETPRNASRRGWWLLRPTAANITFLFRYGHCRLSLKYILQFATN